MEYSNLQAQQNLLLKGVKVELSPNYQPPELVSLPYEYVITNDNIIEENDYDFNYETKYLEDYEKQKKEEEEKRIQELKAKAPGLTDKVLEPVRISSQDSSSNLNLNSNNNTNISNSDKNSEKEESKTNIISEFEDFAPLDPWDKSKTNKDELLQLQMGMNDMSYSQGSNYSSNNNSPKPSHSNLTTINNPSSSPSLSASSMSYTSTYQPPPSIQNGINSSPNFQPINSNYRPPMPPRPMYPFTSYGTPAPVPAPVPAPGPYGGPGINEPSSNYLQGVQQSAYHNRSFSNSTPPPVPSRPNTHNYNNQFNNENDAIINSVVDMGFKRELVLNGMNKYGNDKQKVIDYVMLYSYLERQNYQPKHIDTAIFLYGFNRKKCEQFLKAFMELSEMGFDQEDIKEALIVSENDREAAIDHLTKST